MTGTQSWTVVIFVPMEAFRNEARPATTDVSRRERKKDETRERIAAAAIGLFRDKGFEATTIDEIAGRADVAKGTFFNYFPRKEAVLSHVIAQQLDQLERETDAIVAQSTPTAEKIADLLARCSCAYTDEPALSRFIILHLLTGSVDDLIEIDRRAQTQVRRLVDEGIRRGELRADLDPDRATSLLRGVYFFTSLSWMYCPDAFDLAAELRHRARLAIDGLVAPGT